MLDLQSLPHLLRQLLVIRHLPDQPGDVRAEVRFHSSRVVSVSSTVSCRMAATSSASSVTFPAPTRTSATAIGWLM